MDLRLVSQHLKEYSRIRSKMMAKVSNLCLILRGGRSKYRAFSVRNGNIYYRN